MMYKSKIDKYRVIVQYKYCNRRCSKTTRGATIAAGTTLIDSMDEEFTDLQVMLAFIAMHKPDAHTNKNYRTIRYEIAVMKFTCVSNMEWSWVDHTEQYVPDDYLIKSELYRNQCVRDGGSND